MAGAGAGLAGVGVVSWLLVRKELVDEHIRVEPDAGHFAGEQVAGPLTAFAEAEAIGRHSRDALGGRTFAELESGDPVSARAASGGRRAGWHSG